MSVAPKPVTRFDLCMLDQHIKDLVSIIDELRDVRNDMFDATIRGKYVKENLDAEGQVLIKSALEVHCLDRIQKATEHLKQYGVHIVIDTEESL